MADILLTLWFVDAIWRQMRGSTLAQVMFFFAWHYQAIIWTNIDLLSLGFCGTLLRLISQKVPKISIHKLSLNNILVKLPLHLPGANELINVTITYPVGPGHQLYQCCPFHKILTRDTPYLTLTDYSHIVCVFGDLKSQWRVTLSNLPHRLCNRRPGFILGNQISQC